MKSFDSFCARSVRPLLHSQILDHLSWYKKFCYGWTAWSNFTSWKLDERLEMRMKERHVIEPGKIRIAQPAQNRSLERGVEILRSFRPGADLLGNVELAERTGLSRATVSRLTQTLVGTGLLKHDRASRAYRLAAPVLSLAHAMRSGSPVLNVVAPMMRKVAEKLKVNIGLAVADREEMVYLESVRYNRKVSLRNVVAGQRVPMELTSLGRAWLAVAMDAQRQKLLARFRVRRTAGWDALEREISEAIENFRLKGYCTASWQPEVVALSTPIVVKNYPVYVLNLSVTTQASMDDVANEVGVPLLNLARQVREKLKGSIDYCPVK